MLKLQQTSFSHLDCLLPEPFGAQGQTKDAHTPWSVSPGALMNAHCEVELLTALKADMRDITLLVSIRLSAGRQNIYINYNSIYCLCVVGQT